MICREDRLEILEILRKSLFSTLSIMGEAEQALEKLNNDSSSHDKERETIKQSINRRIDEIIEIYKVYQLLNGTLSKSFQDLIDNIHRYKHKL